MLYLPVFDIVEGILEYFWRLLLWRFSRLEYLSDNYRYINSEHSRAYACIPFL